MRKFLLLLALALLPTLAYAQTTPEEEAEDDLDYYNNRNTVVDRRGDSPIWYGTGAQLGFAATSFQSNFLIGLSPIVGYKLNNFLSVGPRGSITYNRFRDDRFDFKEGYFEWELGAFARAMVFRGFFAHVEYNLLNEVDIFSNGRDLETVRRTRAVPFAGGGINQGGGPGGVGFEVLILFRLTQSDVINDSPFQFRTGINFNL